MYHPQRCAGIHPTINLLKVAQDACIGEMMEHVTLLCCHSRVAYILDNFIQYYNFAFH